MTKSIKFIQINWTDPWTEEWIAGGRFVFNKKRLLSGFYRMMALRFKELALCHTGIRKPNLEIKIIRSTPSSTRGEK